MRRRGNSLLAIGACLLVGTSIASAQYDSVEPWHNWPTRQVAVDPLTTETITLREIWRLDCGEDVEPLVGRQGEGPGEVRGIHRATALADGRIGKVVGTRAPTIILGGRGDLVLLARQIYQDEFTGGDVLDHEPAIGRVRWRPDGRLWVEARGSLACFDELSSAGELLRRVNIAVPGSGEGDRLVVMEDGRFVLLLEI